MNKKLLLVIVFIFLCSSAYSQQGSTSPSFGRDKCLWFEEEDGEPKNIICAKMKVSNGSLVDNGDGSFSLSTGGGSGGGGGTVTLQYNDATQMTGTFTLDISSDHFTDDEDPSDEWNLSIKSDAISTTELDDGSDTPATNDFVQVSGTEFKYKELSEVLEAGTLLSLSGTTINVDTITLGTNTSGDFVGTITAGDGLDSTGATSGEDTDHTLSVDLASADPATATTGSFSGLEFASNELTLIGGCDDEEILKWSNSLGKWQCQADGGGGGGTDDQTIDVFTFSDPNISLSLEDDGEATKTLDISSLVPDTATALAANGANCSAGEAPLGVDASGAVEGCTDYVDVSGDTMTGQLTITSAGNGLVVTDTTDAQGSVVATFEGNRATPGDGDNLIIEHKLSDSGGAQEEFAQLQIVADDVTDTTEDGSFVFHTMQAGTLTETFRIQNNSISMDDGTTEISQAELNRLDGLTNTIMTDDTAITAIDDASLEVNSGTLRRAALTGDVTASAGSNTTAIATDAVGTDELDLSISPSWTGTHEFATITEGGNPVPNDTDGLDFFSVTTSNELASILADETGPSGGFVRATGPTISGSTLSGTTTLTGSMDLGSNCSGGSNGGKLTTDSNGIIICGDDTSGGGSSSGYIILNPGSASITGTIATVGDATQGAQIDGSNGMVLIFDETTDEGAAWRFRLPDNWASHTDLKIMYSMTSGTANEVEWEAAVMCQSDGDAERDDADGFAAIAVASETVPGTVFQPSSVTITLTDDSCAASDLMTLFVSTDADDATNDDATGDRRLLGLVYEYGT